MNVRVSLKLTAASLFAGARAAHVAEPYPVKPIQWVAPFAAGGSVEVNARGLGTELAKALGLQSMETGEHLSLDLVSERSDERRSA